jgi:DNA polymerase-3 subunit epsilon
LSYVVFDFETTGLDAQSGDEIIEIGAVKVDGKNLLEKQFHSMINPQRAIPAESTAVHGIQAKDLENAPTINQVMPDFVRFLGQGILVAQNARFDLSFLVKNLARQSIARFENPILDTMLLSKFLFSYESRHNLDAILNRLKIKPTEESRHRSIGDCVLTAQALIEMISVLEKRGLGNLQAIRTCILKAGPIPVVQQENMSLLF